MTLPASIRVNLSVPFPALVQGSGPIAITKQNGIWTVSLGFGSFPQSQSVPFPATTYTLVWDSSSGVFYLIPISQVASNKVVKTLAAGSPYAAQPTDEVLLINAVPFTVTVDWSTRAKPLRVVDITGAASVATPITITPAAGQTQLAQVNYSYTIDGAGGSITLTPLPTGNGAY